MNLSSEESYCFENPYSNFFFVCLSFPRVDIWQLWKYATISSTKLLSPINCCSLTSYAFGFNISWPLKEIDQLCIKIPYFPPCLTKNFSQVNTKSYRAFPISFAILNIKATCIAFVFFSYYYCCSYCYYFFMPLQVFTKCLLIVARDRITTNLLKSVFSQPHLLPDLPCHVQSQTFLDFQIPGH